MNRCLSRIVLVQLPSVCVLTPVWDSAIGLADGVQLQKYDAAVVCWLVCRLEKPLAGAVVMQKMTGRASNQAYESTLQCSYNTAVSAGFLLGCFVQLGHLMMQKPQLHMLVPGPNEED